MEESVDDLHVVGVLSGEESAEFESSHIAIVVSDSNVVLVLGVEGDLLGLPVSQRSRVSCSIIIQINVFDGFNRFLLALYKVIDVKGAAVADCYEDGRSHW